MNDELKIKGVNSMGYGMIAKLVMKSNIDIAAKGMYAYFCSYAGSGTSCFPSRDLICKDLGISKDRFSKLLKQLSDCGFITVEQIKEHGRFSHNVYTINTDVYADQDNAYTKLPCTENLDTENPYTEKLDSNNNSLNNNNLNNNSLNKKERKKEETVIHSNATKGSNGKTVYADIISAYTSDPELRDILFEFIKMRKLIKSPMTDRALRSLLKKLDELASTNADKIATVEQSIVNNWKSVYPLKKDAANKQRRNEYVEIDGRTFDKYGNEYI